MSLYKGVVWKDAWLGHSETFVRDQIKALSEWDFLKIGFHRLPEPLMEPDYAPYSNDIPSKAMRKILGTHGYKLHYSEKIKESEAQLIHAHFLSGGMNAVSLAKTLDLPLFTTLHNPRVSFEFSGYCKIFRYEYDRRLEALKNISTKFLAVSSYVADEALKAGLPADKIELLPVGTAIVPKEKADGREGIVFVGRLVKHKGIGDLLEAVDKLPLSLRDVPVTIIGDGEEKENLQRYIVERNLNARLIGWKTSAEIPGILAQHQIFCGPSGRNRFGTREGFGMVFLEAALQELPCVAYKSGGVVDAVQHGTTGLLVSEGNINELSEALKTLLQDESMLTQYGKNGRKRVMRDFNLTTQSRKLHDLFVSSS